MPACKMCGRATFYLGTLGRLAWFVCRACGWQQSAEHAEVMTDETEQDN